MLNLSIGIEMSNLRSVHSLLQKISDENIHIGGVALLINRRIPYEVTKYSLMSNRVIDLKITLNTTISLYIIHGYAPTDNSEDEEADIFRVLIRTRRREKTIRNSSLQKSGQKDSETAHITLVTSG